MINCPVCQFKLTLARLKCNGCGVVLEGNFNLPRLARLSPENIALAEQMILCGGNLKELANDVGVSYPTLRKRIDELIASLKELKESDDRVISRILSEIESGVISPEEGIRRIKEAKSEI